MGSSDYVINTTTETLPCIGGTCCAPESKPQTGKEYGGLKVPHFLDTFYVRKSA